MRIRRIESEKGEAKARRFAIEMSPSQFVATGVIIVLGLVWMFIFGILVGRGYNPEETVPELEKLLPPEEPVAEVTTKVIRPEELQYYDKLKEKPAPGPVTGPGSEKSTPEAARKVDPPSRKPSSQPKAAAAPQKPAAVKSSGTPVFQWVYQASSFRKPDVARQVRDRVRGLGYEADLETSTSKGSTWHRVIVRLRGDEAAAAKLERDLQSLRLPKPLLKSKK